MYRTILCAAAALFIANQAVAEAPTLKQQLVGTWMIVSWEIAPANGTKQQTANPKGILMFDAGGRYALVTAPAGRPKFKTASQPTTEELLAATKNFAASNGTWSISEADKILTMRFETAVVPDNEGTDLISSVSIAGDELKLTGVKPLPSGAKFNMAYRRAR
jgi:Lipocalin-like domain